MKKWIKRVKNERLELALKIDALEKYLHDESNLVELTPYERSLMWHQLDYMNKYADVLGERILAAKAKSKKGSEVNTPSA